MNTDQTQEETMKMTQKKRERENTSNNDDIIEIEKPSKKFRSEETKKLTQLNLEEIEYFIAKIDPISKNNMPKEEEEEEEKLTGIKLIFDNRRKIAENLINNIKDGENELKEILEALKYDNTNKTCIYKLLRYYHKKNDKKNFDDSLKMYKFCVTQKFKIREGKNEIFVNLNEFYKITLEIEELEELENYQKNEFGTLNDLRNSLIEFFTSFYYIAKCMNKYRKYLNKDDLKKILSVKYIKNSDSDSFYLDYEKKEKLNLLQQYDKKNEGKKKDNKDAKVGENKAHKDDENEEYKEDDDIEEEDDDDS